LPASHIDTIAPTIRGLRCLFRLIFPLALVTGCQAPEPYPRATDPAVTATETQPALYDYRGLIHVHSEFSHDSTGTLPQLLEAANGAGADFVCITDHGSMESRAWQGMHDEVLLIGAMEVSLSEGHILALDLEHEVPKGPDPGSWMQEVTAAGGFLAVAHPECRKKPWEAWDLAPQITHMEVVNVAADLGHRIPSLILSFPYLLVWPFGALRAQLGRPVAALSRWDELHRSQALVGLGSVDAHFRWYIPSGTVCKLVSTHVFAPALSAESVLDALRRGHCYIAYEGYGSTLGFDFFAFAAGERHLMGSTLSAEQPVLSLTVNVPEPARVDLYRDGELLLSWDQQDSRTLPVVQQGTYRVEVFRGDDLWILSNPIYIR
jgi:hypothetical protein